MRSCVLHVLLTCPSSLCISDGTISVVMASSDNSRRPNGFIPRCNSGVLEGAETLVENLDNLADILDQISDKYETVSGNIVVF